MLLYIFISLLKIATDGLTLALQILSSDSGDMTAKAPMHSKETSGENIFVAFHRLNLFLKFGSDSDQGSFAKNCFSAL